MSKFLAGDPDLRTIVGQKLLKNDFVLLNKGLIVFLKMLMTGVIYILEKKQMMANPLTPPPQV
jgi:hypothetical protein